MHQVLTLLLLISSLTAAQSVSTRMGARPAALANAGFTLSDPSALYANVAALGFLEDAHAFFAFEKMPALPGADRKAVAISWPLSFGTLSAGAFRFGDAVYSEQFMTIGSSHRINHTALGIKANLVQYRADAVGQHDAMTIDVAGLTQLTPEWSVGAGIFNLTQAELSPEDPLPVTLVVATGWKASEGVLLLTELEKKLETPLQVKAGLEVTIHKKIVARAGVGTNPLVLSAGLGAKTARAEFDFAVSYQSVTSFYYQASAGYRIHKPSPR